MKKFAVMALLVCASFGAQASTVSAKILRLDAVNDTYANVQLDGVQVDVTAHPCATIKTHISWDKSTPHGNQMFSLAMTGLVANKTLVFYYSDTDCGLRGNQVLVTRIDLLK